MNFINPVSQNWMDCPWSEWKPLAEISSGNSLCPRIAGLYRIRVESSSVLVYIGQTGRDLRERLRALWKGVDSSKMPFNDPHTAAPNLWAWKQEECWTYEYSVLPENATKAEREIKEDWFLWQHRISTGHSTLCNYGRFHPQYRKSKARSSDVRGFRLPQGEVNPAGLETSRPLRAYSNPGCIDWMNLPWQKRACDWGWTKQVPAKAGLYLFHSSTSNNTLYIGQSGNLRTRSNTHNQRFQNLPQMDFLYVLAPQDFLPHQLREWEVDMLGAYYETTGSIPLFQYGQNTGLLT